MAPEPYNYHVEICRVIDGDSIVADIDLGAKIWLCGQHVRITSVDTPELHGPTKGQAEAFTRFTSEWCHQGGPYVLHSESVDSFGRWLGDVHNGRAWLSQDIMTFGRLRFGVDVTYQAATQRKKEKKT